MLLLTVVAFNLLLDLTLTSVVGEPEGGTPQTEHVIVESTKKTQKQPKFC